VATHLCVVSGDDNGGAYLVVRGKGTRRVKVRVRQRKQQVVMGGNVLEGDDDDDGVETDGSGDGDNEDNSSEEIDYTTCNKASVASSPTTVTGINPFAVMDGDDEGNWNDYEKERVRTNPPLFAATTTTTTNPFVETTTTNPFAATSATTNDKNVMIIAIA